MHCLYDLSLFWKTMKPVILKVSFVRVEKCLLFDLIKEIQPFWRFQFCWHFPRRYLYARVCYLVFAWQTVQSASNLGNLTVLYSIQSRSLIKIEINTVISLERKQLSPHMAWIHFLYASQYLLHASYLYHTPKTIKVAKWILRI